MKIRTGFVSNSSSSSFVLAIRGGLPKTFKAFLKIWFKGDTPDFYGSGLPWKPTKPKSMQYCNLYPVEEMLKCVWNDMKNATPTTKDAAIAQMPDEDYPDCEDFKKSDGSTDWVAFEKAESEHCERNNYPCEEDYLGEDGETDWAAYEEALEVFNNPVTPALINLLDGDEWSIYRLHYADEDGGWGSILEHIVMGGRECDTDIVIERFSHH